ncbi:MAG: hypothetical protein R3A52_10065 [Polyangiales bacterium]
MSDDREWPEHFPPGCPPADANDLSGELFYLAHNPNKPDDFLSAAERGAFVGHDENDRASLSCWTVAAPLDDLRKMPRHKEKVVVRGKFEAVDGKFKPTGKNAAAGHRSTWFRAATHSQLPKRFAP